MGEKRTIFHRILDAHTVTVSSAGERLLYVDRHYLDDTCFTCFETLERSNRGVRRPDLTFMVLDHTVPTRDRRAGMAAINDPEIRNALEHSQACARRHGVALFGMNDGRQGIIHVTMPEQGLTLPGGIVACSDSHTTTHGGLGALGLGVGLSEQTHLLATQTLWLPPLRTMRVNIHGRLRPEVTAKDLALGVVGRIGAGGAAGHFIEFAGEAVRALSVEGRMTLCNMAIEAGGRAGLVAPDDVTFTWLRGRPHTPRAPDWDAAVARWRTLASEPDAPFDREVDIDAATLAPMVTWGTSPDDVVAVTGKVPDPATVPDTAQRERMTRALAYMDLTPGTAMTAIAIDQVFIGSCTNGRLEDLRAAAALARRARAVVPAVVVPGSTAVKRAAEAEGLDRVFAAAGFEWRDAGCSMCVAMNGDRVGPGKRCASTSNRNFPGRQGPGSRTHLMSPVMAAAAALTGRITDPRSIDDVRLAPLDDRR